MFKQRYSLLLLLLTAIPSLAQEPLERQNAGDPLNQSVRPDELRQLSGRQLKVIAPTIAAEEIDRAVLNRLMQEIANAPEVAKIRLGVNDSQLQDIFIAISNAHSFINGSEMANVRAMCNAWKYSKLSGDERINQALDAYSTREQFTKDFIAKYYRVVLFDIESILPDTTKPSFNAYMDDRRRRMASAGAVSWGSVVENVRSGAETVRFHCRDRH